MIFVSIINKSFRHVRKNVRQLANDEEQVFSFILLKIKHLIGEFENNCIIKRMLYLCRYERAK
jgi:hypothetical protein